ncbi:hypothetical protein B0H14DRAFT_3473441 [Mycena olivaceomarginata]|nr:hypothetical protein B0H14DRAFT_3473441 [Mycena olivaceomarginata]
MTEPIDLSLDSDNNFQIVLPPRPKKRSATPWSDDAIDDDDDDHNPSPPHKKKRSSTTSNSGNDDEDNPPVEMSFCIKVETPAPPVLSVRKSNTKPLAPKTTVLGPYEIKSSIRYPDFLRIIAKACRTQTENLVLTSMEWKFDHPNNVKRQLLTNNVGLGVAIKTLKARHRDYVFTVFMSPPSPIKQELPWLKEEADENGVGPLDFDFSIEELTAPGNSVLSLCEQIAGIDNTSNPHFNRLLKNDVLQPILPALQALTHANHAPYGLLPPYYPHQYPPPPFGAVVPAPPVPPAAVQHPPSPPVVLPRTISLDEYCDCYQINADDRHVLVELGYEPGDNGIKDAAKVTLLAKGQILRQHTAFIKDVIAGLWN